MEKYSRILCLDGQSEISTIVGNIPIRNISPGMKVLSYDIANHKIVTDTVTAVAKSTHSRCATVNFDGTSSLRMTLDHPLYVIRKGWCAVNTDGYGGMYGVQVESLEERDACLLFINDELTSTAVSRITVSDCSGVFYCLMTCNYHNFLANGVVAHDVNLMRFSPEFLKEEGIEFQADLNLCSM